MNPKLLIDTKIENFNEAYEKFSSIQDKFQMATKNIDKWDFFSKADKQHASVSKRV